MRRTLQVIAGAGAVLGGLLYAATFAPPRARPLPKTLPHVVRNPPPRQYFPSTQAPCDPGDGIRAMHARGFTGRGAGIAILDSFLLTTHEEFHGRLRWYDELDAAPGDPAQWHGTAVASLAAGRRCGVAPEADLYFVGLGANWKGQPVEDWFLAARRFFTTRKRIASGIRRVLALNRTLPAAGRIRALSLSVGLGQPLFGDEDTREAIAEAQREGLFVSTLDLRLKAAGPLVAASPEGPHALTLYPVPAGSWAIARRAGRYLLEIQRDPSLTPAQFASMP